jgi:hypothetical protein
LMLCAAAQPELPSLEPCAHAVSNRRGQRARA